MRRMSGSPATGIAGLAHASVNGRSRVPSPAASTSACKLILVEQHVRDRKAALLAVTNEETPIGVQQVVGWSTAKRFGCRGDAALAAFDFHVRADRRLVDGDDHVVEGKFLAVLLVPE